MPRLLVVFAAFGRVVCVWCAVFYRGVFVWF